MLQSLLFHIGSLGEAVLIASSLTLLLSSGSWV